MQSGPIVLVRAVVMLACMIVVPLVAIFWKHWPEAIDLARDGQWTELADLGIKIVTQSGPQPSTAHQPSQEAPSFDASAASPADLLAASEASPARVVTPPAASMQPPPQMLPEIATNEGAAPTAVPPSEPAVATVGYTTPVNNAAPNGPIGVPIPNAGETPKALPVHLAQGAPLPSPGSTNESPQQNPFRDMEQRLRTLGATYYLLESWGTAGNLYRFHVKMALAGNSSYNRHFEATDADPLTAMRHVLTEVEAWRSGQQL